MSCVVYTTEPKISCSSNKNTSVHFHVYCDREQSRFYCPSVFSTCASSSGVGNWYVVNGTLVEPRESQLKGKIVPSLQRWSVVCVWCVCVTGCVCVLGAWWATRAGGVQQRKVFFFFYPSLFWTHLTCAQWTHNSISYTHLCNIVCSNLNL